MTAHLPLIASLGLFVVSQSAWPHAGKVDGDGCHVDTRTSQRHCHTQQVDAPRDRAPRAGDEGVFYGPLVRVIDGDSFEAKVQGVVMEFRLAEIDAPEYNQPYGREARAALVELIGKAPLVLEPIDVDRYGRTVARVWVGDVQLNRELVRRGAAWFLSEFARSADLYEVEQEARNAKRGLWALAPEQRLEPWEWRRRGDRG